MDFFEINKYVGSLLAVLLAILVIGYIGDFLVPYSAAPAPMAPAKSPMASAKSDEPSDMAKAPADAEKPAEESGTSAIAMLGDADADAGKKVAKKCTACHSFDNGGRNKVGPNLWDIVGAGQGKKAGYGYSSALAGAGGEWSYEALDAFLADPRGAVKGTKMSFGGIKKAKQRADLIAYMRSLSDSPKPLP